MELGLSLGNKPGTNNNIEINNNINNIIINNSNSNNSNSNNSMEFCMGLGLSKSVSNSSSSEKIGEENENQPEKVGSTTASPPRLQLDLLPLTPLPRHTHPLPSLRFPWLSHNNGSPDPDSSDGPGSRTVEANKAAGEAEAEEQSSPNSGTSSLMELSLYINRNSDNNNNSNNKRSEHGENGNSNNNYGQEMMMMMMMGGGGGVTTSRGSDDEENGSTRKKLRLSKEQSAFLEDNFKEHHTLNPKQKLALAKQLNLRPRQVEVWFQNRRARTKLKQTEVDCEYLKRCCETLTEENRRLQKELQELRALKTSQPFFMHLPPTTLTMCPSCERVAPASVIVPTLTKVAESPPSPTGPVRHDSITLSLDKSRPNKLPIQTQIRIQPQTNI